MNGADILCDTLLANDIDVCFANPGTSEMHFVAALDRRPKMRCVLGLFEGVVTGAADGYARMADKPAATLLHLGPGLANGIANLHNARRAHTPMVNIVGDHATHHLKYDAPLTSDIESLARPISHWIGRAASAELVAERTREAIAAAHQVPGQIATLILHADAAWSPAGDATPRRVAGPIVKAPDPGKVEAAAKALKAGKPTTIIAGGLALREAQSALLDRIAAATNTRLIAQQANGRMARGAGRPALERVPYVIEQALALFEKTEQVILVGAREPVAFFAYPGKPSHILPEECAIFDLTGPGEDMGSAIEVLAEAVGIGHVPEARVAPLHRPDAPSGALTAEAIALAVARHMPENAIICDESITSGRNFLSHTHGAQPHDFLQLTGGAIGIGPPLATGAAIACPDRKVIALQADGSGMYTVQALWTQAREALDVVTIVFANRRYQILRGELQNVGAGAPGENARRMLDLNGPELDWVKVAAGMGVEGARADTAEAFDDLLASACRRKGPFLIEAMI